MKKAIIFSVAFILAFYLWGFVAEILRVEYGVPESTGGIIMLVGVMAVLGMYAASQNKGK